MADYNEDTLLASMKEAIQKEKDAEKAENDTEKTTDEDEGADEPDAEYNSGEDADKGKAEVDDHEDEDTSEDSEPTRGQTRHQKLANQLKEEKAERERDRKEREQLIAEKAAYAAKLEQYEKQQEAGKTVADRRAEEERLSLLTDSERAAYFAQQKATQLEHRLNELERKRQDDMERAEFRAKAAYDPLVEKYADRVEQLRQDDIKRLGMAASRDSYLNFIVGEAMRKDATKKASSKKEAADKRIDSVTSKSAKARGDVSGTKKGKGDSLEELEARLRGVVF